MKYILFALVMTCAGIASADSDQNNNEIKKKWMDWANENVAREKEAFLKKYGIAQEELNDAKLHADLKSSHDTMIQDGIALYDRIQGTSVSSSTAIILEAAKTVFSPDVKVRILSHDDFLFQQVGVCQNYETKECFIDLNSEQHVENIPRLKEILMHELSHVIHEDNFHIELAKCLAWTHSEENHVQIEEASYPLHHAHETRADIYAVIHSPDHGKHLIDFLKADEEMGLKEPPSHPVLSERIALLQKIRQDLVV